MSVSKLLERKVRERAKGRCEYCRMHQSLQGASFHVEHVIPCSHGGQESLLNLVLACPSCNLHKSNRVEALDPESGEVVPFFHPLADVWDENFFFVEFEIVGKTACGRATLEALNFNHPRRLRVREAEAMFDLFPPE